MARKTASPRKPKGRGAKSAATTEFAVEEGAAKTAKPPMSLESALIIVTLLALVAAFVLINIESNASFGQGWPV